MTIFALLWVGCSPDDPASHETPPPTVPTLPIDSVPTDSTTPATGDTGPTTPSTVPFDCTTVPSGPRPTVPLEGLFPSEDFVFDEDGHLISATGTELVKQDYPPGTIEPFVSTDTDPSSMRMLPTGDLVYANIDTSTLFRVQMDGVREAIVSGFGYATGIDVSPTGIVFIGDAGRVKRIDPDLGTVDEIFDNAGVFTGIINGLTFSEDRSTLYMGTSGEIYGMPVDVDGNPTAGPTLLWEAPIGELLGMGFDVCGGLYALHAGSLLRFSDVANWKGGDPEVLMSGGLNTTNLQWGSGLGGWDELKIYVTDRNAARPPYYEVDVGVPAKHYW